MLCREENVFMNRHLSNEKKKKSLNDEIAGDNDWRERGEGVEKTEDG